MSHHQWAALLFWAGLFLAVQALVISVVNLVVWGLGG